MSPNRVTVQEAAKILGVTEHAVRQRLYRRTLESEKDGDGRVFVLLEQDARESPEETHDRDTTEMVEMLADQVRYLREQLNRAEDRDRENRRIIAALTQRIPAIEAPEESPSEPRDGRETVSEGPVEGDLPPEREKPVSWWRKLFPR